MAGTNLKELVIWLLVLVVLLAIIIVPVYLIMDATGTFPPLMSPEELHQAESDDISVYNHDGYFSHPQFTHDGSHIVYIANSQVDADPGSGKAPAWENDIWMMAADGTGQSRITRSGDIPDVFLDPATDTMAYSRSGNGTASIMLLAGANASPVRIAGPLPFMYFSSFSPDGKHLAITGFNLSEYNGYAIMSDGSPAPQAGTNTWSRLYITGSDGTDPRFVANVSTDEYSLGTETSWSPDGTGLAIPYRETGVDGIGIVDPQSGTLTRLTRDGGTYPRWSPGGALIAFIRHGDAYVIRTDGAGEVRMSQDGTVNALSWNPDGSRLEYSTDHTLCLVDPQGGNLIRLSAISPGAVSWKPDGKTVALSPGIGARIEIMTLSPGVIKMGEHANEQMEKMERLMETSSGPQAHLPVNVSVNITRSESTINVRFDGGSDADQVRDLTLFVENEPYQYWESPRVGEMRGFNGTATPGSLFYVYANNQMGTNLIFRGYV